MGLDVQNLKNVMEAAAGIVGQKNVGSSPGETVTLNVQIPVDRLMSAAAGLAGDILQKEIKKQGNDNGRVKNGK